MRIKVILEFDENDLGPKWMNPDNLDLLLYTENATKKELLKVLSFEEMGAESGQLDTDVRRNWQRNQRIVQR